MTDPVRFDDSLSILAKSVVARLGHSAFEGSRVVRDAYGRLTFLSAVELDDRRREVLKKDLLAALGPYASTAAPVMDRRDLGAEMLLGAPTNWRLINLDGVSLWIDLVDRRIVGQDWVIAPRDEEPIPPRLAFASIKGGVGRSTALCVLAVHLAQAGKNVLVVDADLEAPGLGALLLRREERPDYGLLDYLVEGGLGGWRAEDFRNVAAPSLLTDRTEGQGLVNVVPAVGARTLEHPTEMLAKLSRGLLEQPTGDGPRALRDQLRTLVDELVAQRSYDAVLIDARAGLSEVAAGPILGLGADVLFFGVNQPQTFEGLSYLLAHLAHLPRPQSADRDWRRRLHFVQSKADPKGSDERSFQDQLYEVLSEQFYESDETGDTAFNFSIEDREAPHVPLVINFDFPYMQFDPVQSPGQLRRETYRAGFQEFLTGACRVLGIDDAGRSGADD